MCCTLSDLDIKEGERPQADRTSLFIYVLTLRLPHDSFAEPFQLWWLLIVQ
jgi:hypothetical protein